MSDSTNSNLYGYVNNDPANFTDPSGLSPKSNGNDNHPTVKWWADAFKAFSDDYNHKIYTTVQQTVFKAIDFANDELYLQSGGLLGSSNLNLSTVSQLQASGQTTWARATFSAVPVIGSGYNWIEGEDLLTGQQITGIDRVAAGFQLLSDVAFTTAATTKFVGYDPNLSFGGGTSPSTVTAVDSAAIAERLNNVFDDTGSGSSASTRLPQDIAVNPTAPDALPLDRPVGMNANQNLMVQQDIAAARAEGGTDFRVNQQQVNAAGERVGTNRPDLQYTDANGQRVNIEYDTSSSGRGAGHEQRLLANDPTARVILKTVD